MQSLAGHPAGQGPRPARLRQVEAVLRPPRRHWFRRPPGRHVGRRREHTPEHLPGTGFEIRIQVVLKSSGLVEDLEATVKKCVFIEDGFKCLRESIFSVFNSCLPEYNELACFQLIVSGAHGTRASATGPADRETGDGPGRWLCRPRTEAGVPASLLRRFLATAARAQVRNAVQ